MEKDASDHKTIYLPDQPFLVIHTQQYLKYSVKKYGILCFYAFITGDSIDQAQAIPAGCIDLVFRCDKDDPAAYVYGPILHARKPKYPLRKNTYFFGVQFMPGWLPAILRGKEHFADYMEQELPLDDLLPESDLIQTITSTQSPCRQIQSFLDFYMPLYEMQKASPSINQGNQIACFIRRELLLDSKNGQIQTLANQLHVSTRYINRVFRQEFGMPPKLFFSLIRFQQLLIQINRDEKSLSLDEVAKYCGYYDRSHMSRDFLSFANLTLRDYQRMIRSANYRNLTIFP